SILSGDNMGIASYTKNKDLALAFLKQVTDKDAQINYQKLFGDLPTNAEALATFNSAPHMGGGSRRRGQVLRDALHGSILSGDNMGIASYTKNKDLALAFLKQVTDKDAQ
ncbi:hypothetical protein CTI14_56790, partial [Methylobacterium radiotolerans]